MRSVIRVVLIVLVLMVVVVVVLLVFVVFLLFSFDEFLGDLELLLEAAEFSFGLVQGLGLDEVGVWLDECLVDVDAVLLDELEVLSEEGEHDVADLVDYLFSESFTSVDRRTV